MTAFDSALVYLTVFGTSAVVLVLLGRWVRDAGRRLGPGPSRVANAIALAFVAWFAVAIVVSLTAGLTFPNLAPMLAVPWTLGLWVMFTRSGSQILAAIPVHRLIALSIYRVAGAIFLYCYYCCATLSRGFALNAGWGDVLTGVLAAPVAWAVWKRVPYAGAMLVIWSLIGIGDLILAPASAAIYGAGRLEDFPISLIPLFLGPPFGILLHFITLRAAWLQRDEWRPIAADD